MARPAIKASDDSGHQLLQAKVRRKGKQRQQREQMRGNAGFAGKKFSELNNPDKDELLKAIALQLDLIEPDDD